MTFGCSGIKGFYLQLSYDIRILSLPFGVVVVIRSLSHHQTLLSRDKSNERKTKYIVTFLYIFFFCVCVK